MKKITLNCFNSLAALCEAFHSDRERKEFLAEQRWGDIICPHCGQHHCIKRVDGRYRCTNCKYNFSVLVGTIFENSKISLAKWFMAMYIISSHKTGISSHQLARDIGVTQKTAWYISQKIRTLFSQEYTTLEDEVECDETYIGGIEKNKHEGKKTENNQGRFLKTKTPVFGMVERGGKVIAGKVGDTKGATLSPIIRRYVKPGSRVFTDEYIGYNSLYDSEYTHSVVHHNTKEFAVGDSHTNTIEGFWGQLKRMITGIYHFVSARYLQRYVDEAVFRYNTRKESEGERFDDMFAKSIGIVRYADVKMVA